LFLFVLQLLDLQTESNKSPTLNIISPIAILFSLSIFTIVVITSYVIDLQYNTDSILSIIVTNTYSLNNISSLQIGALSDWLYGTGLLPLITICIILLVAMIAPISLCKVEDTV
jgi:NADH:ubiquinone oxidoreductase subunit 6 (subunit J)